MSRQNYGALRGMNKKNILNTLGEGFNFYPRDIWTYDIQKTWWGKKTVVLLIFREEVVETVEIKHYYFK
ncbi:MAG: hypothetical protein LBE39_11765 [Flavobacteriaceae bacterium]|jgi:hypothetical protein|nr:hypothetical protein [Flavobacteriaceae bacterium]